MPQGGVDEGEDNLKAAFRELEEETSIKSVELIKELDGTLTYDLPDRLLGIIWKGNCLLYTSPSPRDAHESRMPSSA